MWVGLKAAWPQCYQTIQTQELQFDNESCNILYFQVQVMLLEEPKRIALLSSCENKQTHPID
jgi:hypothetical protein